jgi:hypothetical protein
VILLFMYAKELIGNMAYSRKGALGKW